MKFSSFQTLSLAALALTALGQSPGVAATLSDGKHAMPIQVKTQTPSQPRVALPSRTEVLAVDWVDTKNAKIAIGGITYALTGALPHIVLAGGEQVTNIGYLKSGMQVKIRTAPDGAGNAQLVEITVIG